MTVSRGRPPRVRNVYSFEDAATLTPGEVVVDTSFVIQALISTEPKHAESQDFMLKMASHGTVIYFNRLLELEFAEVAFKLAVIEQHGKKAWPQKRADGRVRRRAGRLADDLLANWRDLLTTVSHLCVELEEVVADVPALMTKHGLASYDAVHAATAAYVAADGLLTTDAGFGSIPASKLRIYTDATRVKSCRRRRGGRSASQ